MREIFLELGDEAKFKIIRALKEYSPNEIGGILIGEKNIENNLIVSDVSVSNEAKIHRYSSFTRETKIAQKLLEKHHRNNTGYYIGEWHSHPNFALYPSVKDVETMEGIISDPNYNVSFAILCIVKLNKDSNLEMRGFLFHRSLEKFVTLNSESDCL